MKYYRKVRFWGGLGIMLEPFALDNMSKDWFAIGAMIVCSALLNQEKFQRINTALCGQAREYRDTHGNITKVGPNPVRCILAYAILLNILLYVAGKIGDLLR